MKAKIFKLTLVAALSSSVLALAKPRKLGVDFGDLVSVPVEGLNIGWYLEGEAQVDGRPVDYARLDQDEAYARRFEAQNSEALDGNKNKVKNVIYKEADGIAVTDVPKPANESRGNCFHAGPFNSNHRSCELLVDRASGFLIFQATYRWGDVANVQAIRYNFAEERATAWGNLTEKAAELFADSFRARYEGQDLYDADKDGLVYSPTIKSFVSTGEKNTVIVKGNVNASIPKADETHFDETLDGKVKLIDDGDQAIRFERIETTK